MGPLGGLLNDGTQSYQAERSICRWSTKEASKQLAQWPALACRLATSSLEFLVIDAVLCRDVRKYPVWHGRCINPDDPRRCIGQTPKRTLPHQPVP
eukprot:3651299-Amphidinium_carterae.1